MSKAETCGVYVAAQLGKRDGFFKKPRARVRLCLECADFAIGKAYVFGSSVGTEYVPCESSQHKIILASMVRS